MHKSISSDRARASGSIVGTAYENEPKGQDFNSSSISGETIILRLIWPRRTAF